MLKNLLAVVVALGLTGCANNYQHFATQSEMAASEAAWHKPYYEYMQCLSSAGGTDNRLTSVPKEHIVAATECVNNAETRNVGGYSTAGSLKDLPSMQRKQSSLIELAKQRESGKISDAKYETLTNQVIAESSPNLTVGYESSKATQQIATTGSIASEGAMSRETVFTQESHKCIAKYGGNEILSSVPRKHVIAASRCIKQNWYETMFPYALPDDAKAITNAMETVEKLAVKRQNGEISAAEFDAKSVLAYQEANTSIRLMASGFSPTDEHEQQALQIYQMQQAAQQQQVQRAEQEKVANGMNQLINLGLAMSAANAQYNPYDQNAQMSRAILATRGVNLPTDTNVTGNASTRGVNYQRIGNTIFGSDGSSCQIIGNNMSCH